MKLLYVEELGGVYSETFVAAEKKKFKSSGVEVDSLIIGELSFHPVNLFRKLGLKSLFFGVLLSLRSLPNFRRFLANIHATLLFASNIEFIHLKVESCDEVRAHFLAKRSTFAYLIFRIFGVDYSAVAHAADIFDWDGSIACKIKYSKRCDCISNYNVGFINAKLGFRFQEKLRLIRNSFYRENKVKKFTKIRPVRKFLIVSRLIEKKGLLETIYFFSLYKKKVLDAKLDIIGDGPQIGILRNIVGTLNIENSVTFHGVKSSEFVQRSVSESDMVALMSKPATPRLRDMDGLPTVFFEAANAGIPILTNSISGIPELVIDGFNGILADDKSLDTLVAEVEDFHNKFNRKEAYSYFQHFLGPDVVQHYLLK